MAKSQPISELAWRLADYETAGRADEAPPELTSNPELTEGEMMSTDDVEAFIKDSVATLRILSDKASPRYDEVAAIFRADISYLVEVGQIDADDYNELTDPSNLRF